MGTVEYLSEQGILRTSLKVGVVSTVSAEYVKVNLAHAGDVSGSYAEGGRYGRGEVGEFVLVEGQEAILLGRLSEVRLPDRDRSGVTQDFQGEAALDAIGYVQLLGSVSLDDIEVKAGISAYPRLGDRVFSAPGEFLSSLPSLMNGGTSRAQERAVSLHIGNVSGESNSLVEITPEKLFGRHCAILGATGGGKSWTTTKLIEECSRFGKAKVIVIDATSEYRSLSPDTTLHFHLGSPIRKHDTSREIRVPPTDFDESDFIALFDPSGKVQGPKLREAIKSLRLAALAQDLFPNGYISKVGQNKNTYREAMNRNDRENSKLVDRPDQPFDVSQLIKQIREECAWDNNDAWGNLNENEVSYCSSLFTRIQAVVYSTSFTSVFGSEDELPSLGDAVDEFLESDKAVLRLCVSDVSYEFFAREIIANVIGRKLLKLARDERFREKPVLAVIDEAHNFLGKRVGSEEHATRLDSFELIAKEGRKYGLNICLTTQRPRDITEGVLSQVGTLLVHRLTNDRDREVVERACGEIDRSSAAFLPNLKQGEVALIGVDFPIPMTIQIGRPVRPPFSDGPDFQKAWVDIEEELDVL